MPLAAGARLGPYEIVALIGVGGMGEVYRGRDTKLNRDVAIKVLPESVGLDPERLSRFHREAQLLAALNHPNIAQVHGFEDSGVAHALVMELVEGATLAERMAHGPMPLADVLPIARQLAEALEAAHTQGIIHRDLKPANIKIRDDGVVKVLDFGLAKFMEPATAQSAPGFTMSPTMTAGTVAGVVLGTVAYMSPEQARGKPVDKRTDIWAFGVILYEMLRGREAFAGETISDTIVSVLTRDIEWTSLPALPHSFHRLLQRCLQRDPNLRLRDIGDAKLEIIEAQSPSAEPAQAASPVSRTNKSRAWLLVTAAFAIGLLAGAVAVSHFRAGGAADQVRGGWKGTRLGGPTLAGSPRLSPDGKKVAFRAWVDGLTQVAVMNPVSGDWKVITHDREHGYVTQFSWSRDGSKVYFDRFKDVPVGLYSVPEIGGEERPVIEDAGGGEPLADGSLLITRINQNRRVQLHRFWPEKNELKPLPALVPDAEFMSLSVLPDGTRAVFWGGPLEEAVSSTSRRLFEFDAASEKITQIPLPRGVLDPADPLADQALAAMDDAAVVVGSSGDLTVLSAVDLKPPHRVRRLIELPQGVGTFDVAPDGTIYAGQSTRVTEVWRVGSNGEDPEKLSTFPISRGDYRSVQSLHSPRGKTWATAVVAGRRRLLVAEPPNDSSPFIATADETGGPLALLGEDRILFVIGSGDEATVAIASTPDGRILQRLQSVKGKHLTAMAASRDGKVLYFVEAGTISSVPTENDAAVTRIHAGDGVAVAADGKSLIIQLIEAGGVRLIRTDLDGGNEQPIPVRGDARFTYNPIGPGAVAPDGRIVLPLSVKDSWFWVPGVFDPRTGVVNRVMLPFMADPVTPAWTSEGRIISLMYRIESSLWRFTPEREPK